MAAAGTKRRELDEDALRLRVGIVAIFLVLVALGSTVLLEGRHFGSGVNIQVELGQLGNIVVGTPVKVSGRKIGQVDRVTFASREQSRCKESLVFAEAGGDAPRVLVTLWVRRGEAHRLRTNSEFFVNQGSILAPQYIEVLPPPREIEPGAKLKEGDVVCGTTPPRTDRLLSRSLENMGILREAAAAQGPAFARLAVAAYRLYLTLESLPADPDQGRRIVTNVRAALSEGEALYRDLEAGADLRTLQRAARRFSALVQRIEGDLARLSEQTRAVEANLGRISGIVTRQRRAELRGAIAELKDALARGRRIARTAREIADAIANAEGTLGLMMADRELFDDFKEMNRLMKERPMGAMGVPPPVVDER